MSNDKELADKYQQKTDKQHILDNPDTYIGSVEEVDANMWVYEDGKIVEAQVMGDKESIMRAGKLASGQKIAGFTVFQSNNAPAHSASVPILLAGHVDATATASQVMKSRVLPNPNAFGYVYDGLHVYGRKVLRTNALAKMFISIGNV